MQVTCLPLGELDTNCYVLWDDRRQAVVVDPADSVETILAAVGQLELTVCTVVLTHVHFDHMLAAEALCAATGAPLWVGAGDEGALTDPMRNLSAYFNPDNPATLHADRLLHEGDTVAVGDTTLTVWETPGHTPGCLCLVGEDVVLAGDTLFASSIGRIDFPGGDVPAMERSLQRLLTLPESMTVYSGHGPATTIGREKRLNPYLR